ncbi:MAG: elongation factor P [Verrucomicrobiota bacterium]
MAKVNANDLRPGQAIKWNNDTCLLIEREHRKPGKGPAYIQASMRSLTTGRSFEERFRSSESLELVNISREKWAFSYKDQSGYQFMNLETYDNLALEESLIGDAKNYLTEDLECDLMFIEGRAVSVDPPPSVALEVTESPEGLKGDTATGATKPATLETGLQIQVPLFIKEGEKVTVDTRTGKYTGRA